MLRFYNRLSELARTMHARVALNTRGRQVQRRTPPKHPRGTYSSANLFTSPPKLLATTAFSISRSTLGVHGSMTSTVVWH